MDSQNKGFALSVPRFVVHLYSPVYLKTLHNQLSAIFNHAVKYYNLSVNPAAKVGNMGKAKSKEMLFWTKAEYSKFADAMMDKPIRNI